MIREALSHFPFPAMTAFALLLFLAIFTSMLFWVFRRSGRAVYQHLEHLPIDEEHS